MNFDEDTNINEPIYEPFIITEEIIEECVSGALEE